MPTNTLFLQTQELKWGAEGMGRGGTVTCPGQACLLAVGHQWGAEGLGGEAEGRWGGALQGRPRS